MVQFCLPLDRFPQFVRCRATNIHPQSTQAVIRTSYHPPSQSSLYGIDPCPRPATISTAEQAPLPLMLRVTRDGFSSEVAGLYRDEDGLRVREVLRARLIIQSGLRRAMMAVERPDIVSSYPSRSTMFFPSAQSAGPCTEQVV